MSLQKYLIKSFKIPILTTVITSTAITCFAFMTAIIWLISQTSNIFSGQATKDDYFLFFIVINIVLTFSLMAFSIYQTDKKKLTKY